MARPGDRFRLSLLALTLALGSAAGALACDDEDEEIGTPCESEEDCSEGLICDVHDGQGTCQRDHGHRISDEEPDELLLDEPAPEELPSE